MGKKINSLKDIGSRNPFTVPEKYFAQFNEEIMNRLPHKKILTAKKTTLWEKTKPWIYMAAMFIGLFFSIRILTTNIDKKKEGTNHIPAIQQTHPDSYWSNVNISEDEFFQYLEEQSDTQTYYDFIYEKLYKSL